MTNGADFSALYQELILDHYRRPRNKGVLERADASVAMRNPLCGDEIDLYMAFEGDNIKEMKFSGSGCAISQASASMMTQLLMGKSREEAGRMYARFRQMVMGDEQAGSDASLNDVLALSSVARFPARVKCALLAWNALEKGLSKPESD